MPTETGALSSAVICNTSALGSCMLPENEIFSSFLNGASRQEAISSPKCGVTSTTDNLATVPQGDLYLRIIEEPVDKIRYRYKSEKGSHGGLTGINSTKNHKTYPKVKLENYYGEGAVIIKASLFTSADDSTKHVHKLLCRNNDECEIKLGQDKMAEFSNIAIQYATKEERDKILLQRKLEKKGKPLTLLEKQEVKNQGKVMDMNSVRLCFQAFYADQHSIPLCPGVFSHPIYNQRSTEVGDLKICRISKIYGSCRGGDQVFLLTEKVKKEDIKVRLYELNDLGEFIWEAEGQFSKADVHHQVAIVFTTPPYVRLDIEDDVRVFMDLYRSKDCSSSERHEFTYRPDDELGISRKRKKLSGVSSTTSTLDSYQMLNQENEKSDLMYRSGTFVNPVGDELPFQMSLPEDNFINNYSDEIFINTFDENFHLGALEADSIPIPNEKKSSIRLSLEEKSSIKGVAEEINTGEISLTKSREFVQKVTRKLVAAATEVIMRGEIGPFFHHMPYLIPMQNSEGDSLLHIAILYQCKNIALITHMINAIKDRPIIFNLQNTLRQSPAHLATALQRRDILKLLLENGSDPNMKDHMGNTCIHLAAQNNSLDCLTELIFSVKNVLPNLHLLNNAGFAPLHVAVVSKTVSCVKLLLQAGADINQREHKSGRTPLHLAAELCPSLISVLLAQPKIEVNAQDFGGNTALHLACANGEISTVQELMKANADITLSNFQESSKDTPGLTAADFAEGNADILKILSVEMQENPESYMNSRGYNQNLHTSNSKDSISFSPTANDSGYISGAITLMDLDSETRLCKLLDPPNNGWFNLGTYLGMDEVALNGLQKLENSPTKILLIKFQEDGGDSVRLIQLLQLAEMREAKEIVQACGRDN